MPIAFIIYFRIWSTIFASDQRGIKKTSESTWLTFKDQYFPSKL